MMNIVAQKQTEEFDQSLAMALGKLSQQNQWVFLIAPKGLPKKKLLEQFGADLSRLLVVHCNESQKAGVVHKALTSGNAAAVVSWGLDMSAVDRTAYKEAANDGNCLFLAINQ